MQNPSSTFKKYWQQALKKKDPCADYIFLATVNKGKPEVRTVLLKTLDQNGVGFVTQALGPKAKLLRKNPQVAGCIVWPSLNRQIRFTGRAKPMSKATLQKLWKHRPREAQLLYHLGIPQSSKIPSFEFLLKKVAELDKKWSHKKNLPLSPYYIGFVVELKTVEFFTHHRARLNRREFFQKRSNGWIKSILAP